MSENEFKVVGRRVAPPPEKKKTTTVRLYVDDLDYLSKHFPDAVSRSVRRMVRRGTDQLRTRNGDEKKGMPND